MTINASSSGCLHSEDDGAVPVDQWAVSRNNASTISLALQIRVGDVVAGQDDAEGIDSRTRCENPHGLNRKAVAGGSCMAEALPTDRER